MRREKEKIARERGRQPAVKCAVAALLLLMMGIGMAGLHCFPPEKYDFWPKCLFHEATGLLCPGCGATRALFEFTHGHFLRALRCNLLLPALLALGVGWLLKWKWLNGRKCIFIMLAGVLAYAILRNLPFEPFTLLAP